MSSLCLVAEADMYLNTYVSMMLTYVQMTLYVCSTYLGYLFIRVQDR